MDQLTREPTVERYLAIASLAALPLVALAAWLADNPVLVAGVISAVFSGAGFVALRCAETTRKPIVGLALIGQSIALTAALSGHPWQIDAHMTFFAALAVVVSLNDIRSIVLATIAIALHHGALTLAMPAMVYPSTDLIANIERTAFHAVVIVLEAGALCYAIMRQERLQREIAEGMGAVVAASRDAEKARDNARAAQATADLQKAEALDAKQKAEGALRALEEEKVQTTELARREAEREEALRSAAEKRQLAQQRVVDSLGQALNQLSKGDLTVRLNEVFSEEYETLRKNFNDAVTALGKALEDVSENATQVLDEATAIGEAAALLSKRTEHQAATLEETAAAMEEVTTLVKSTAENASLAAGSAHGAQKSADESGAVVARASEAMTAISTSAGEITKIISVIDDIAFQTNLLALNAGVEAARAGDAGRGFAVVASEVRALAQRSSEAAKEISALISRSQIQVGDGVHHVNETVKSLSKVTAAVREISERMQQIASSANEQASGLGEINTALMELDGVTQQNAAMFEETAAAANKLTQTAQTMGDRTRAFRQHDAPVANERAA